MGWRLCCIMLWAQASSADLFGVTDSQAISSHVAGYHPTEAPQSVSETHDSVLASDVNFSDPWENSPLEKGAGLAGSYDRTMSSVLAPMIPGEAVWRQPAGDGMMRGQLNLGLPVGVSERNRRVSWQAGPLAADVNSIGMLAYYSTVSGQSSSQLPDNGFVGALMINAELMLHITESAYLHVNVTPYYLLTENKVGIYLGSGNTSGANLGYTTYLKGWEIKLDDTLRFFSPLNDLLDEVEVNEIADAGRYRIGRKDNLSGDPFSEEDLYLLNTARLGATNWLSRDWQLKLKAERLDVWRGSDFEKFAKINRLGAAVFYDRADLWFMPWAAYDWYDVNDSQLIVQQGTLGVTLPFTPRFHAYAKGNMTSTEVETGDDKERPGWEAGLSHKVTSALSQSLFLGNTFFFDELGDPFLGTYWRYSARYGPVGSRYSVSAYLGGQGNDLNDYEASTAAGSLETRFSLRTRASLTGMLVEGDQRATSFTTQLLRLSIAHQLSKSCASTLSWQIFDRQKAPGNSDPNERLIMLSLQWQL
jgi:hypothetical protein